MVLDPLAPGEFVGLNFEGPQNWGVNPNGTGYNLTGATQIVFDAISPTGGIQVQFSVNGGVYWSRGGSTNPRPFGEIEFRGIGPFSLVGGYGGLQKTENLTLENGYDNSMCSRPIASRRIASVNTNAYGPRLACSARSYGPAQLDVGVALPSERTDSYEKFEIVFARYRLHSCELVFTCLGC